MTTKQATLSAFLLFVIGCSATNDGRQPVSSPTESNGTNEVVSLADSHLEQVVLQTLNLESGPLQLDDLLSISQLSARDRGVKDLSGIDALTNLTALDLANNSIQDISPLHSLTKLKLLDLEGNLISDISALAHLSDIESLILSYNEIFLDGSGETNLTEDPSIDSAPSWSPDGAYLAFHSKRNGNFDIFLMDLKEKRLAQVTFGTDNELAPALADKAD